MEVFTGKAYAKINLGLDVLGVLPNGYHEVSMIMQTLNIYDELTMRRIPEGITLCEDSGELPLDENNLICKAVRLMQETYHIEGGVSCKLVKRIPIAAGMAGGSSDAALALRGMNELYEVGATLEDLRKLGAKLGADIPYCLVGGTVLAEGIGEVLTSLPAMPDCFVLVAKPECGVLTGHVYKELDRIGIEKHPDIPGMCRAIQEGSLQGIIDRLGNVLELVTAAEHPVIGQLKGLMVELGAEGSLMSGSGPTVFGIFTGEEKAAAACEALKVKGIAKQIFVTSPVSDIRA